MSVYRGQGHRLRGRCWGRGHDYGLAALVSPHQIISKVSTLFILQRQSLTRHS